MNDEHLPAETLARLKSRTLPAAEIEAAVTHAASCAECGAALRKASVAQVRNAFRDDPPRHLAYEELAAIADGLPLTEEQDEHLAGCEICRAELDDLRPLAQPRRRYGWWVAAAAAVLIVLIGALLFRRAPSPEKPQITDTNVTGTAPEPPPQRTIRPEWQRLVDDALAKGRLPFPDYLAALHASTQTLRGEDPNAPQPVRPSGIVLETPQPTLSWPRVEGASYVVSIYDGETLVAQSSPLNTEQWPLPDPLPRGKTFTWQVEATRGGETTVLPAPPNPPARFRVVDEAAHRELEAARAEHPGDHLLLAVLHARAGLEREAREQLLLAGNDDPRVRVLQTSVK